MKPSILSRVTLIQLYEQGNSMVEIAQTLRCSPHKIVYWMDKYEIKRRSRSEALYRKRNPFGDPFLIKQNLNEKDIFLYGLGLGIYWGEGEKVSKYSIRVANTDPYILILFSDFLQKICGVKKEKMTFSLVCFNDSDPIKAKNYWAKMLGISDKKFGKIVIIPKQGKGVYKRKSQFGVCTITVSNIKLKLWIMQELNKLKTADIV